MSTERLPKAVPLPEISQHTENIVFGGLGLPVGFDQERVTVNLRKLDYFRQAAGLNAISIVSTAGETEPTDATITSVNEQGAATVGLLGKRVKTPLSSTTLRYPVDNDIMFNRPNAVVKINNTELETRLEEKPEKYEKGAFDIKGRASFLNRAVKRGLAEANFDSSFSMYRGVLTGGWAGAQAFLVKLGVEAPLEALGAGLLGNMWMAGWTSMQYGDGDPIKRMKIFKEHRYSLFYGLTPDRYVAAQGVLTAGKIVKARS
jgi:hypothetical protein